LPTVFQNVVDSACELTGARYGALGIFGSSGKIEQFITHGVTDEERTRIGALPQGLGILGWLQGVQEPIRLGDLTGHPRSAGFPPNHPHMKTFLGVPVRHGEESMGNLYLTEKEGGEEFTPEDENLLILFAAQAAMAIRNAQLYRQVQDLAVLEERDRIGMDLHDGVIQSLYATGLKLEGCLEDLEDAPAAVAPELQGAIQQLNLVIADIRSYVMNLLPSVLADTELAGAGGGLLQELRANDLLDVELAEQPGACRGLSEEQVRSLFLVAQESLTNVRRHANATRVSARIEQQGGRLRMTIADNGVGFDPERPAAGRGVHNMRERLAELGGTLEVCSQEGAGTQVVAEVPALGAGG
ncbi:MAG: GAF domain-containing sensor histidine kinase, partial [Dehalococcoidia bacterium]|nr:GAF domain-containing sensor histidine kinase [Dehalococcoidia bacterium]